MGQPGAVAACGGYREIAEVQGRLLVETGLANLGKERVMKCMAAGGVGGNAWDNPMPSMLAAIAI